MDIKKGKGKWEESSREIIMEGGECSTFTNWLLIEVIPRTYDLEKFLSNIFAIFILDSTSYSLLWPAITCL